MSIARIGWIWSSELYAFWIVWPSGLFVFIAISDRIKNVIPLILDMVRSSGLYLRRFLDWLMKGCDEFCK